MGNLAYWIGGDNVLPDKIFQWVTAESNEQSSFFAPGEPGETGAPSCLVVEEDELWHDKPSNRKVHYICELD